MKVAIYVTSHGFGHASRQAALVNEFIKFGIECVICSDRPRFLFPQESGLVQFREIQPDTGMFQTTWKSPDVDKTIKVLKEFWADKDAFVAQEKDFMTSQKIAFAVVDVPILPIIAANELDIPVYAITNFDWHFNYRGMPLVKEDNEFKVILNEIEDIYSRLDKSYILPFSIPESVKVLANPVKFGNLVKIKDYSREELCVSYNIPKDKIIVLISFGGILSDISYFNNLTQDDRYFFLTNADIEVRSNVKILARDVDFSTLISACDVVITKVGYSTLAEVSSNGTYLCYATRDDFPEDDALVSELVHYPQSSHFKLENGKLDITLPNEIPQKIIYDRFKPANEEIALDMIKTYFSRYTSLKATLDFGTNNSTLMIYSLDEDKVIPHLRSIVITALGKGLKDNLLTEQAIDKAIEKCYWQFKLCQVLDTPLQAVATNIGRICKNFYLVQSKIRELWRRELVLIHASLEAELGGLSAINSLPKEYNLYSIDIGGSSTEICLIKNRDITNKISIQSGILYYYNKLQSEDFLDIQKEIYNDLELKLQKHSILDHTVKLACGIGKVYQNINCILKNSDFFYNEVEVQNFNVNELSKMLMSIMYSNEELTYTDIDNNQLNKKILYISISTILAWNKLLGIEQLAINPFGIEYGLAINTLEK